ncbi:S-adenosyl-L-methionine-dependent methyltransferase [Phyllosticta capitalensis]|uniref:S-adenosyl-L-methionine-dependent methyltransferase n=1 Tax=Phyllosticta capitalensis TaxID=121624 RepID=A0ABR1Z5C1_9PEZI
MAEPTLKEYTFCAIAPAYFIGLATIQWILTLLNVVFVQRDFGLLFDVPQLKSFAFGRFWNKYGAFMSADMPPKTTRLLSTVRGTILDVGPGTGDQLCHFDAAKITKAYGVEPTVKLHDKLRSNAKKAGLGEKYTVLGAGAEPESLIPALAKAGVLADGAGEGVFDEIVVVRCLCHMPKPKESLDTMYRLLKPGGRLVTHEHVCNPWGKEIGGSFLSLLLQYLYVYPWEFFINCRLNQDTRKMLFNTGGRDGSGWSEIHLEHLNPWSTLPELVGYLVKKA